MILFEDEASFLQWGTLSEQEGFGSYGETEIWLMEIHHLDIPYKTVHKTLLCYLGCKPREPRPSHIRKDEKEVRESGESLPEKPSGINTEH